MVQSLDIFLNAGLTRRYTLFAVKVLEYHGLIVHLPAHVVPVHSITVRHPGDLTNETRLVQVDADNAIPRIGTSVAYRERAVFYGSVNRTPDATSESAFRTDFGDRAILLDHS